MTRRALWVRSGWFLLAVGAIGTLIGFAVRSVGAGLERASIDARFAVRGEHRPPDRVAIVALDNDSLRRIGQRPPLDRRLQARLIDRLDRAGARVVAYDFSLEQPTRPGADIAIVQALYNTRHAVVSVAAPDRDGSVAPLAGIAPFRPPVRPGYTLLEVDPDGEARRFTGSVGRLPWFPSAVARADTGRARPAPPRALIDYPGPPGTFGTTPFADVLDGRAPAGAFADRIVLVGPTATVLGDRHRTPVGSAMAGVEINAAAIATALDDFPLRRVSAAAAKWTSIAVGFVIPVLALLLGAGLRRRRPDRLSSPSPVAAAAVAGTVLAAWLLVAQLSFDHGQVVELLPGVGAAVGAGAASIALAVWLTSRERRLIRARFAARDLTVIDRTLSGRRHRRAVGGGDIIPGFRILEPVESGGMGEVYRARQERLDRDIALKLIRQEYAADEGYRSRFVDEAFRASAVAHPNLMPVIDAGDADGLLFIAMPFVASSSLARSIAMLGPMPADWVVPLLHRVACALDVVHDEAGLIHRDVKPGNILIPHRSPLTPYLIDFGVASATSAGDANSGTPNYMAPERRLGQEGRAGDVYALAVTLYECLAGSRPSGEGQLSARRPDLPRDLDDVLDRGLAADPAARPPTAAELTRAAAACLGLAVTDDGNGASDGFPSPAAAIVVDETEADAE